MDSQAAAALRCSSVELYTPNWQSCHKTEADQLANTWTQTVAVFYDAISLILLQKVDQRHIQTDPQHKERLEK